MMTLLEKYASRIARSPADGGSGPASLTTPSSGEGASPAASGTPSAVGEPSPDSGGGAPAPSSPAPAGAGELDFAAIFGSDGSGAEAPEVPPAAVPEAPPQPSPKPTPAAAPAEAQPTPAVEAAPVAPPAAQATPDSGQPQQPPTTAVDPYDPGQLASHLTSQEAAAVEFAAQQMFQLSNEEREALEQDVIGTVPKLLAKVFVKSQLSVLNQLNRMIPAMVQRQTKALEANARNEDKFYSRWPQLDRAKHGELTQRYGAVYRQMHPDATLEQMIEDLGPMVMMAARVIPSVGAQGAVPGQPLGQPATPSSAANGRSPPPSPFVPAGAGPAASSKRPEKEAWEAMWEHPG